MRDVHRRIGSSISEELYFIVLKCDVIARPLAHIWASCATNRTTIICARSDSIAIFKLDSDPIIRHAYRLKMRINYWIRIGSAFSINSITFDGYISATTNNDRLLRSGIN